MPSLVGSEMCIRDRPATKAKSNGKMERSPHSTRHYGTSKRAMDPADARNGPSQHSPAKRPHCSPSTRHTASPHTPRRKKERTRASRSTSRSASTDSEREGRKDSRRRRDPDPPSSSDCSTSEDDDDVHNRPKHTLKPPKFDGQGSFETFMAQFMNCAKHNKWTRLTSWPTYAIPRIRKWLTYCVTTVWK